MGHTLPLKDLPTYSVFAFITGLSVYIVSSRNAVIEYAKNIELLRSGDHPSKELVEAYNTGNIQLKILHEFPVCPLPREARVQYNIELNKMMAAGYTNLRPNFKSIKYKLQIKILSSFKFRVDYPLVYVYAQSARWDTLVLGIFRTMYEAEEWATSVFPDRKNVVPVFHDGELLKEYRELHGMTMKRYKHDIDLE
tara:strand:- start:525 stop:1109 length:585 start_codon:yes stop_codon:yes gene_type:complete